MSLIELYEVEVVLMMMVIVKRVEDGCKKVVVS